MGMPQFYYPLTAGDDSKKIDFADGTSVDDKAESLAQYLFDLLSYYPYGEDGRKEPHHPYGGVLALCGAWGSGKTTFLNHVVNKLDTLLLSVNNPGNVGPFVGCLGQDQCENEQILFFNPWMFGSRQTLIEQFFKELEAKFAGQEHGRLTLSYLQTDVSDRFSNSSIRTLLKELCEALLDDGSNYLVEVIGESLPFPLRSVVKKLLNDKMRVRDNVRHASNPSSKDELKRERLTQIRDSLKDALMGDTIKPRLIIIDNVDRLSDVEIQSLFRFVGAVLDLPKIYFLLVFDRSVAESSLENVQAGGGEAYLDKIIDVYFELPEIDLKRRVQEWLLINVPKGQNSPPFLAPSIACLLGTTRRFNHAVSELSGRRILSKGGLGRERLAVEGLVEAALFGRFPNVYHRYMALGTEQHQTLLDDVAAYPSGRRAEKSRESAARRNVNDATGERMEENFIPTSIDENNRIPDYAAPSKRTVDASAKTPEERIRYFLNCCFGSDEDAESFVRELDDLGKGEIEKEAEKKWSIMLSDYSLVWLAMRLLSSLSSNQIDTENDESRDEDSDGLETVTLSYDSTDDVLSYKEKVTPLGFGDKE